tara:strand:- start:5445 stop:6341 length:897 start_codon:yes stop_codon:yes gene_type:complete
LVKLTIGLPTYNCEDIIEDRIKELLGQSFTDYVLIISDNSSTDKTREICEKMTQNDKRVNFFHHEENRGPFWNFNFLLNKANTPYFIWAAADDLWSNNFLEKNIDELEKNADIVGSTSEMSLFYRDSHNNENIKILKNIDRHQYVSPISGRIENKIRTLLNFNQSGLIYSVFRTNQLKRVNTYEWCKNDPVWRCPFACLLGIIKEGDLNVIYEGYIFKHTNKNSTSIIEYMIKQKFRWSRIIFFNFPFTQWAFRIIGFKKFFQNFNYFVKLNIKSEFTIITEVCRMCVRKMLGRKKYW